MEKSEKKPRERPSIHYLSTDLYQKVMDKTIADIKSEFVERGIAECVCCLFMETPDVYVGFLATHHLVASCAGRFWWSSIISGKINWQKQELLGTMGTVMGRMTPRKGTWALTGSCHPIFNQFCRRLFDAFVLQ